MKELQAKIREALLSALPVTAVVYLLSLTPILDLSSAELITFSVGAVLLVVGIGLFSLGADLAMTPMGTQVGSGLSRQKKLGLLCGVCFLMGMLITIAEPDLQVLANQVSTVMNGTVLTGCVGPEAERLLAMGNCMFFPIADRPMTLEYAMEHAEALAASAADRLFWALGAFR